MKKEKKQSDVKELSDSVEEQAAEKIDPPKKQKKIKKVDAEPVEATKIKKSKSAKVVKKATEPKEQKAPKEDKVTKFLVSMKKSVRKSVKKEAAEVGVSMNEYIVLAVEEKLNRS